MEASTSISGILLVLLGVLAAIVLILVLRLLNKKLNIFTRGTVSFILFALIVFTCIDTVNIMNGIRISEASAVTEAARQTASNVLCTWLDKGVADAAHQIDVESDRSGVKMDLDDIEKKFAQALADENSPVENFRDLRLVSLSVDFHGSHFNNPFNGTRRYGYKALLDDGKYVHELTGRVGINDKDPGRIRVVKLDGKWRQKWSWDKGSYRLANNYRYAQTFQSKNYRIGPRGHDLVRVVPFKK